MRGGRFSIVSDLVNYRNQRQQRRGALAPGRQRDGRWHFPSAGRISLAMMYGPGDGSYPLREWPECEKLDRTCECPRWVDMSR